MAKAKKKVSKKVEPKKKVIKKKAADKKPVEKLTEAPQLSELELAKLRGQA